MLTALNLAVVTGFHLSKSNELTPLPSPPWSQPRPAPVAAGTPCTPPSPTATPSSSGSGPAAGSHQCPSPRGIERNANLKHLSLVLRILPTPDVFRTAPVRLSGELDTLSLITTSTTNMHPNAMRAQLKHLPATKLLHWHLDQEWKTHDAPSDGIEKAFPFSKLCVISCTVQDVDVDAFLAWLHQYDSWLVSTNNTKRWCFIVVCVETNPGSVHQFPPIGLPSVTTQTLQILQGDMSSKEAAVNHLRQQGWFPDFDAFLLPIFYPLW